MPPCTGSTSRDADADDAEQTEHEHEAPARCRTRRSSQSPSSAKSNGRRRRTRPPARARRRSRCHSRLRSAHGTLRPCATLPSIRPRSGHRDCSDLPCRNVLVNLFAIYCERFATRSNRTRFPATGDSLPVTPACAAVARSPTAAPTLVEVDDRRRSGWAPPAGCARPLALPPGACARRGGRRRRARAPGRRARTARSRCPRSCRSAPARRPRAARSRAHRITTVRRGPWPRRMSRWWRWSLSACVPALAVDDPADEREHGVEDRDAEDHERDEQRREEEVRVAR